jgi:hypothetical protein
VDLCSRIGASAQVIRGVQVSSVPGGLLWHILGTRSGCDPVGLEVVPAIAAYEMTTFSSVTKSISRPMKVAPSSRSRLVAGEF